MFTVRLETLMDIGYSTVCIFMVGFRLFFVLKFLKGWCWLTTCRGRLNFGRNCRNSVFLDFQGNKRFLSCPSCQDIGSRSRMFCKRSPLPLNFSSSLLPARRIHSLCQSMSKYTLFWRGLIHKQEDLRASEEFFRLVLPQNVLITVSTYSVHYYCTVHSVFNTGPKLRNADASISDFEVWLAITINGSVVSTQALDRYLRVMSGVSPSLEPLIINLCVLSPLGWSINIIWRFI